MNLVIWFCIIGIALGAPASEEESCQDPGGYDQSDMDVAEKSIEGAGKVLDVYDKTLDRVIPWNVFHETMQALEKGRGRYSQTAGTLVGQIVTSMLNSENHYFTASQSIYGWCGESIPLLEGYLYLFKDYDKEKAEGQKELLINVLDTGLEKMNIALDHINQSIANFDIASGKLNTLDNQLELDFKAGSKIMEDEIARVRRNQWIAFIFPPVGIGMTIYNEVKSVPDLKRSINDLKNFFKGLRRHVATAIDEIKKARDQLKRETIIIENLQCQTKVTRTFVALKVAIKVLIVKHANNLIGQCRAYRRRHGRV